MTKQVLQQALEALENVTNYVHINLTTDYPTGIDTSNKVFDDAETAIEALREALALTSDYVPCYSKSIVEMAQQGEQQPEERIRLADGEWPIIELGFGKVEVAEGWQGEVPALIFGRNGTGKIGEPTQPDRVHLAGETLTVVAFANVESLDVVAGKLATIRAERFGAAPAAQPMSDEQLADFVGDEYHNMTDSELRWFRLGEAAHGIGAEYPPHPLDNAHWALGGRKK